MNLLSPAGWPSGGGARVGVVLAVATVVGAWSIGVYASTELRSKLLRHRVRDLYRTASKIRNEIEREPAKATPAEVAKRFTRLRDGMEFGSNVEPCVALAATSNKTATHQFCAGSGQSESTRRASKTLPEIADQGRDWDGRFLGPDGETYLGGFAYSPALQGLVGLYVSRDDAIGDLVGAAIPWAAGLAAVSLVVLPFAIGLIYRSSTKSQVRTDEAIKAEQLAKDQAQELGKELLRFRAALEQAREAIVILDVTSGRILDLNDTACKLLRHSKSTLLALTPAQLKQRFQLGEPGNWPNHLNRVDGAQRPVTLADTLQLRIDGSVIPVEISVRRVEIGNEAILVAVVRDVSRRRQAEAAARASEMRYRAVVQTAGSAIVCVSPDGAIFEWNLEAERIFGIPRDQALGGNYFDLCVSEADRANTRTRFDRLLAGQIIRGSEKVFQRSDGQERCLLFNADSLMDADGATIGAIAVFQDITDRKRGEEEGARIKERLQQAQKLEAIGLLAGGVAHDFNNLLTSIMGFAELTLDDLPPQTRSRDNLQEVVHAGERAQGLVSQLLLFSRQSAERRRGVRFANVVEEALRLLKPSIPDNVRLQSNTADSAGLVQADPTQLHQVVMNLCTNAIQAMSASGGELRITLDRTLIAPKISELEPGYYVRLTVNDDGPGIDLAIKDRIFDPFFTTKDVGEGSGLGLSVVHGIVQSLGGLVTLESQPGEGVAAIVLLPEVQASSSSEAIALPQGSGRVLLVDDEPSITRLGSVLLERLGYEVSVCTSSVGAAAWFSQSPERYDLVIVDLAMPKMNGLELARSVLAERSVPILLATGYAESVSESEIEEAGVSAVIRKPFDMHELAQTVHDVLKSCSITSITS